MLAVIICRGQAPGQSTKRPLGVNQHSVKRAKPNIPPTPHSASRSHRLAKQRSAFKTLSPALVDSFRTIILTSCTDEAPEPMEISMREEIVRWLNVRYRKAGISMQGVDCSGFIKTLYGNMLSIDLPHSAAQQSLMGLPIDREELRFGDLLFFRAKKRISHAGIYLGEGYFVHSSRTFGVRVDRLFASRYYRQRFARARRIASFADAGERIED